MPFPEDVKAAALKRSAGRCECNRREHDSHRSERCRAVVTSDNAEYRHRTAEASGGNNTLFNCEVLCLECFEQTLLLVRPPSPLDRSP